MIVSRTVRAVALNYVRRGRGSPLLLVHGLGAGWRSWNPVLDGLAMRREVIAVDLPGFGETPPLTGEVSIARADAYPDWLHRYDHHRGHIALGGRPPASRVTNLSGQYS